MLKQRLATHLPIIFLRLLSTVAADDSFPGNDLGHDSVPPFIPTFKEICLERLDPLSCQSWDSMRFKIIDLESPDSLRPGQARELDEDGRTSGTEDLEGDFQEEIPIEIPIGDGESNLQKRFTVFRRKNPTARGYKRGPGFRSWGGKRDSTSMRPILEKKAKFVSWGGKRDREVYPVDVATSENEDALEKRAKFQNWGGKRTGNNYLEELDDQMEKRGPIWKDRGFYLSEPFKKHVPKRPQFQSWGGKRAPYPWHQFLGFLNPHPRFLWNGGEKRKFSSWGGKRRDEPNQQVDFLWGDYGQKTAKRHAFQNWGGKRKPSESEPNQTESEVRENGKEGRENGEPSFNINSSGGESREGKARR